MSLVLPILFASVLLGLFVRRMTPATWLLLAVLTVLVMARTYVRGL